MLLDCLLAFFDKHVDRPTRFNEFESPGYFEGPQRASLSGLIGQIPQTLKFSNCCFIADDTGGVLMSERTIRQTSLCGDEQAESKGEWRVDSPGSPGGLDDQVLEILRFPAAGAHFRAIA